ncbi:MAG TPA: VWA domain-containing protein [Mariprofundaceae bacterium]|nr:VWA domain-containing protein [Mariprofundaceae bacterium]
MRRVSRRAHNGLAVAGLATTLFVAPWLAFPAYAASPWSDPFLTEDPAHYPQPQAVESVPRAAKIKLNPSMSALPPGTAVKSGAANSGARIELLQVLRSDEIAGVPAPAGMEAIVLFTRWTNVHPKQKVSRASLESAGDRSFGAGGLHSGGSGGKEEMVDMDVAYKVPIPSRHLWLIAGGEAYRLQPASSGMPDGMDANKPFGIAHLGETRDARMAWFVPKGMSDIELRLFDYDNGHVSLPVAGDMKKAETPARTSPVDAGKSGELELSALGMRSVDSYAGQKAPAGWRFAVVDLLGKSIAKQNNMGALVFADPSKYLWLTGDGGSLHYGLPPEDGSGNIVFTPEVASRQSVAFVVPERENRFTLGLRGRSDVLRLKATAEPPAAAPAATQQWQDAGALTLGLIGTRRENGITIVDLMATPESGSKGVEINARQQFVLKAGNSEYHPDAGLTRRLFRQPPEPFVLPPDTPVRFELAYSLPADAPAPSLLRYRGFAGEGSLQLAAGSIADVKPGAASSMSAAALEPVVVATAPAAAAGGAPSEAIPGTETAQAASAEEHAVQTPARPAFVPPSEKPKMMPIVLPPFDAAQAIAETEPNNKLAQSTPLGKGLAAKGTLGPDDEADWYTFRADGEPQLWSIEAAGPGFRSLGLYAAGERRLAEHDSRGKDSVRLDNLLLLPGQYWIKLSRMGQPGAYTVRAVPLGRPDKSVEFEPNDHPSQAHILHFGDPRRGLIGHQDDVDNYRFSIDVPTHLALTLTPPPDLRLTLKLEGNGLNVRGDYNAAAGEPSRYEALLMPGEYLVSVQAEGSASSDAPYELRLDRLDPFDLPADLSPNGTAAMARKLPGDIQFNGSVGAFAREDWFALPAISAPTRLSLTLSGTDVKAYVRLVAGDGTKPVPTEEDAAHSSATAHAYQAALQPGSTYLLQISGQGNYHLGVGFNPPLAAAQAAQPVSGIDLSLQGKAPAFSAYRDVVQQGSLALSVTNRSAAAQNLSIEALAGSRGWETSFDPQTLSLAPGQSAVVKGEIRALPDRSALETIPLYVHAAGQSGAGTTVVPLQATCSAPALSPQAYQPLPAALLGGLNLAWSGLGAEVENGDKYARGRQAMLFDEMTPLNQRYEIKSGDLPADITVKLAGGKPADIAGITLFPGTSGYTLASPIPFTVLLSVDGTSYTTAYSGILDTSENEQAFVFDKPRQASHVRLHLDSPTTLYGAPGVVLSEWKVIAVPGSRPLGDRPLNIADATLGGHVVWASWSTSGTFDLQTMLTEADEAAAADVEKLKPVEWVVGFHHDRAARITKMQWVESVRASKMNRRPDSVSVSISLDNPNGPWKPLANWKLQRDQNGMAELVLDKPVWARFVRFAMPGSDTPTRWQLAETLRIFEQPEGNGYLSMLGEWGHYRRAATYEAQANNLLPATTSGQGGGTTRNEARPLPVRQTIAGSVEVGARDEWYRIDTPKDLDRLELAFSGDGAGRLEPKLEDGKGEQVTLEPGDEIDGARIFHARVQPGASYYLKVAEAKRSIMIVWDNSGSVGDYHETMYRAIARFADDIRPGLEAVNLLPFKDGRPTPLLPDWTSDPLAVKRAIGSYDRRDESSDAENNLLAATNLLAKRPGNRGIVLLTDAESPGIKLAAEMWEKFRKIEPRIFTLELQLNPYADKTSHFQDLMQDWASVNHGAYAVFRNQTDLDVAFDRAACLMRRPTDYQVAWRPAPGAGHLNVVWEKGKAMSGASIELILDASGSMKSTKHKVDGKLKIDVAKEVMKEIIDLFPDDTQVGLRVYGNRRKSGSKGSCEDSQLVTPIGTLDRKRLIDQIQSINALGDTPIAYSLQQAGEDLARIKGPRHIVLITDGKEECNGDPAKAVEQIRAKGVDARIDIVGFALTDKKDKADMDKVAGKSGGRFFDAQNREALANAINEALAMPFEVLDGRENRVGEGLTGQGTQNLYQGNYTVIVHTAKGDVTVRDVPLTEGSTTKVILSRSDNRISYRVEAGSGNKL